MGLSFEVLRSQRFKKAISLEILMLGSMIEFMTGLVFKKKL